MALGLALLSAGRTSGGELTAKIAAKYKVKAVDTWFEGRRTRFDFKGREAWVVEPPEGVAPAEGRPWTWTMQWRDAFVPRTGVPRLLKRGFHHATVETFSRKMDAEGLRISAEFQRFLVEDLALAPKARLVGMSWGGFFSIRYASVNPDKVDRIYLDAPLLNFDGFPAGQIAPWKLAEGATGWSDNPEMPVNRAKAVAAAGIPILLLYGGADKGVPPALNCELFAPRFKAAGGRIKVVCRKDFGHHPHGVDETDDTIVDFMTKGIQ